MRIDGIDFESGRDIQPNAWLYLEEITHRALNDYTAMLAMVRRALALTSGSESEPILTEVGVRLRASAMTYLALRPPQDDNFCDLSRELATLCTAISNSILSSRGITLTLSADPMMISSFRCWQISLVISELITNAARHAFQGRDMGNIIIKASAYDGTLWCAIIDDGAAEAFVSPGRGTTIVNALIRDLGGTISREHRSTGSTIAFFLPLADAVLFPKFGA